MCWTPLAPLFAKPKANSVARELDPTTVMVVVSSRLHEGDGVDYACEEIPDALAFSRAELTFKKSWTWDEI